MTEGWQLLFNYTLKLYNGSVAKKIKKNFLPVFLSIVLFILIIIAYQVIFSDKYYPFTFVGETNITFLTEGQAIRKVQSNFQNRLKHKLPFEWAQGNFNIDLATSAATLDYSSLDKNFKDTHKNYTFFSVARISPKITLNIDKQLDNLTTIANKQPENAKLFFDETPTAENSPRSTVASQSGRVEADSPSSRIKIIESVDGFSIDREKIKEEITSYLLFGKYQSLLPFVTVRPEVTTEYVQKAKTTLEQLENSPIKLNFENKAWTVDTKQLLALLDLQKGENFLDKDTTYLYLEKIASEINRDVVEGLFEFNPATKRVAAFKPSQEGRRLDKDKTYQLLSEALINNIPKSITLPVDIVKPKIETSDINSLGIKELLGQGISNFAGSITNRIYNINLTASKINGVLIPPGETFSFNKTVGDISAATGFKQAYVIKEGRTVLDDGGGVCQDSTTLFRAVLNAGLPVVSRTAHAYRVWYYEQGFPPGLDATVFYPSVDFQFKNDTPAHILIQAHTAGTTLYIELYGTSDNRVVNLTQPVITNKTPPPPELRQDDPTLPKGQVKQVDWAAAGATVIFKRTVTRNGEVIAQENWKSNYKPWQAVFLVGTQ